MTALPDAGKQLKIRPALTPPAHSRAPGVMEHPGVERVEIRGHTCRRRPAVHNLDLSTRAAATVKAYRMALCTDGTRLAPIGIGESRHINPPETAHETNQRSDFIVARVSSPAE